MITKLTMQSNQPIIHHISYSASSRNLHTLPSTRHREGRREGGGLFFHLATNLMEVKDSASCWPAGSHHTADPYQVICHYVSILKYTHIALTYVCMCICVCVCVCDLHLILPSL